LALACALGAKFSSVVLLPIFALFVASCAWTRHRQGDERAVGAAITRGSIILVAAFAVLWAIYLFPSDPLFYWNGLTKIYGDKNPTYYFFFRGEFSKSSWPSYFAVAWLIKTPLPVLLLTGLALVSFVVNGRKSWLDESMLLLPLVALFVAATALAEPMGVRYVIPCFPLLYIFIGRVGASVAAGNRALAFLLSLLLVWQIREFASVWPNHLSYFNQLAGGWRGGTAWLDDSNVDWGQNFPELRDYLATHPRPNARLCYFVTPYNAAHYGLDVTLISVVDALPPPRPGTLILSAHCVARARAWLDSQYGDRPENWMARSQPTAIVGQTYYFYDVPDEMKIGDAR